MGPITYTQFREDKTIGMNHDSASSDRTEYVNPNNEFVTIINILFDELLGRE
jgi:hypothetical protein